MPGVVSISVYDTIIDCSINIKYDDKYISIPGKRWNKPYNVNTKKEIFNFVNSKVGNLKINKI